MGFRIEALNVWMTTRSNPHTLFWLTGTQQVQHRALVMKPRLGDRMTHLSPAGWNLTALGRARELPRAQCWLDCESRAQGAGEKPHHHGPDLDHERGDRLAIQAAVVRVRCDWRKETEQNWKWQQMNDQLRSQPAIAKLYQDTEPVDRGLMDLCLCSRTSPRISTQPTSNRKSRSWRALSLVL